MADTADPTAASYAAAAAGRVPRHSHTAGDVSGTAAHTHVEADVTSLVTDLAGKAAATHTHAESDVTNLTADLAAKFTTPGVWTSYTPTVTNATLGNGTATGAYCQIGNVLLLRIEVTFGTTSSYTASQFSVSLPGGFTAATTQVVPAIVAPGGTQFLGYGRSAAGSSALSLRGPASSTATNMATVDSTHPATWTATTSNFIELTGCLEVQ